MKRFSIGSKVRNAEIDVKKSQFISQLCEQLKGVRLMSRMNLVVQAGSAIDGKHPYL